MIALQDSWLIRNGKSNIATKSCLKKVADTKKKVKEKEDQAKEKAKSKNQRLEIRRLAMTNYCRAKFGTFKTIFSDLPTGNDLVLSASPHLMTFFATSLSATSLFPVSVTQYARAAKVEKKKVMAVVLTQKVGQTAKENGMAKRKRTLTSPPVLIQLIIPESKQKVRVTSIIAENILSHHIRSRIEADDERVDDKMDNKKVA